MNRLSDGQSVIVARTVRWVGDAFSECDELTGVDVATFPGGGEGDGANITIRTGPREADETALDATISWPDSDRMARRPRRLPTIAAASQAGQFSSMT